MRKKLTSKNKGPVKKSKRAKAETIDDRELKTHFEACQGTKGKKGEALVPKTLKTSSKVRPLFWVKSLCAQVQLAGKSAESA